MFLIDSLSMPPPASVLESYLAIDSVEWSNLLCFAKSKVVSGVFSWKSREG